jgi:hypothetical protein
MKLKLIEFKQQSGKYSKPALAFGTTGLLTLNKAATLLLKVTEENSVCIHQDEERPDDFYLQVAHTTDSPKLRFMKSRLVLNYSSACHLLRSHFKLTGGFRVYLGDPVDTEIGTVWTLITAPLKQAKK